MIGPGQIWGDPASIRGSALKAEKGRSELLMNHNEDKDGILAAPMTMVVMNDWAPEGLAESQCFFLAVRYSATPKKETSTWLAEG